MIKWFKYFFLGVIIIGSIVLGAIFTSNNNQLTSIVLFGFLLPELSVGMWLLCFLFFGSLIGLLLSCLPLLWGRRSSAAKDRKIIKLEKKINELRGTSLKG